MTHTDDPTPRVIRIAGVCERDLDLLLVEELIASPDFRQLIAGAAGLPEFDATVEPQVMRSVTHSSGESDVECYVTLTDGRRAALLIENKVGAALQPRQQERYRARGAAYLAANRCALFRTLVIAPRRYFGAETSSKGFDGALTYEEIDQWFASQQELGQRANYKRSLVAAAIEKGILGYQPIADSTMSNFWLRYRQWVEAHAPQLNMPEQNRGRPSGSTSVFFKPDRFLRGLVLVHKITRGHVDLEFSGQGHRLDELRKALLSILPAGGSLVRAGKSAALWVAVSPLDVTSSEDQEPLAVMGIRAAADLLDWYREHEAAVTTFLAARD